MWEQRNNQFSQLLGVRRADVRRAAVGNINEGTYKYDKEIDAMDRHGLHWHQLDHARRPLPSCCRAVDRRARAAGRARVADDAPHVQLHGRALFVRTWRETASPCRRAWRARGIALHEHNEGAPRTLSSGTRQQQQQQQQPQPQPKPAPAASFFSSAAAAASGRRARSARDAAAELGRLSARRWASTRPRSGRVGEGMLGHEKKASGA